MYDNNFANDNEVDVRSYTGSALWILWAAVASLRFRCPPIIPVIPTPPAVAATTPIRESSTAGTYLVYNCSSLNVRAAPTTSSALVGSIASGTTVKVKGSYNGWAQISYNGVDRWVYMTYLKSTATSLVVTFDAASGSVSETSHTYPHGGTFGSLPHAHQNGLHVPGLVEWRRPSTRQAPEFLPTQPLPSLTSTSGCDGL